MEQLLFMFQHKPARDAAAVNRRDYGQVGKAGGTVRVLSGRLPREPHSTVQTKVRALKPDGYD
jgi:hypothetical protein